MTNKFIVPSDITTSRLNDQIDWYDKKSGHAQTIYKRLKMIEVSSAALIPFLIASKTYLASPISALLGIMVTIIEGILQINQYQEHWILYRSTCESLKHEKFLYLAQAAHYKGAQDAHALLAERVESLVSQEHAKWASTSSHTRKAPENTE